MFKDERDNTHCFSDRKILNACRYDINEGGSNIADKMIPVIDTSFISWLPVNFAGVCESQPLKLNVN